MQPTAPRRPAVRAFTTKTGRCHCCGADDGEYCFGPMMHPGTFWCERCRVQARLNTVREGLAELEALEAQLVELGGPAQRVVCGYVNWRVEGDTTLFGAFCELDYGHTGCHEAKSE